MFSDGAGVMPEAHGRGKPDIFLAKRVSTPRESARKERQRHDDPHTLANGAGSRECGSFGRWGSDAGRVPGLIVEDPPVYRARATKRTSRPTSSATVSVL